MSNRPVVFFTFYSFPENINIEEIISQLRGGISRFFSFEPLEEFLEENSPKSKPCALKKVVEDLPRIKIQTDNKKRSLDVNYDTKSINNNQCTICLGNFENDDVVIELPCKDTFHQDCILSWLQKNNTCCNGRYQLLTEDKEYNERVVVVQNLKYNIITNTKDNKNTNDTTDDNNNNTTNNTDNQPSTNTLKRQRIN